MKRISIPARTPWEPLLGYSRAVRTGPIVAVGQTSAVDSEGRIQGGADVYQQAVFALRNNEAALHAAGAELKDVVRTRMYLARFSDWPAAAKAHAEMFGEIKPAVSILAGQMVSLEILVEFEADAVVPGEDPTQPGPPPAGQ
jgi:enamine deaminase RidA (YjgF/YER057c/UK114 family)